MGAILCNRHVRRERPPSPAPTCVSMKSDRSNDRHINFQNEDGTNASRQVHETDSCQGYARKGMLGSQQKIEFKVSQPDIWSRNKESLYKYFVIVFHLNTNIPFLAF